MASNVEEGQSSQEPGSPAESSFHPSRLRDSPPPIELKSAQQVFRLNQDDLQRYTADFYRCVGDLNIATSSDYRQMPKKDRLWLRKRIRNAKASNHHQVPRKSIIIHVTQLDRLNERLREVADKGQLPVCVETELRSSDPSPDPETPSMWLRKGFTWKDKDIEERESAWHWENYNRLLEDGGHPTLKPTELRDDLLYEFSQAEFIFPWSCAMGLPYDGSRDVFHQQLSTWEFFRRWQRYNRGLRDTGGFEEFAIHSWRKKKIMGTEEEYSHFLQDIRSENPSFCKAEWEREQLFRVQLEEHWREDCSSFEDYGAAVERRLAKHDFPRAFQPNIDPKSQDHLTTQIEYLAHMFWWLDINKHHHEEMMADAELYSATKQHEYWSLDRDDPEWEAEMSKAENRLNGAKETCRKLLATKGKSKGSIFFQVKSMRIMGIRVSCIEQLTRLIKGYVSSLERGIEMSRDEPVAEEQQTALFDVLEATEDGAEPIPVPQQGQSAETHDDAPSTAQLTSTAEVPASSSPTGLKRRGSLSGQDERNTKVRKSTSDDVSLPAKAPRRSKRIPDMPRIAAEKLQKKQAEKARRVLAEEEARKARAEKKARRAQEEEETRLRQSLLIPPTRRSKRIAETKKREAENEFEKARKARAEEAAQSAKRAKNARATKNARTTNNPRATKNATAAKKAKVTKTTAAPKAKKTATETKAKVLKPIPSTRRNKRVADIAR